MLRAAPRRERPCLLARRVRSVRASLRLRRLCRAASQVRAAAARPRRPQSAGAESHAPDGLRAPSVRIRLLIRHEEGDLPHREERRPQHLWVALFAR
eukprot:3544024-Pleurochrysis_carterae.AAC.2